MNINYQFEILKIIKDFFNQNHFLEVITPLAVQNPGMETHIHPFQLYSVYKKQSMPLYLHTSPEFCMKEILSNDRFENIYQISYCFRDEPSSPIHRNQFLMLEWYRKNERYEKIMDDVESLVTFVTHQGNERGLPVRSNFLKSKIVKKTMQEIFLEFIQIDILDYLELDKIQELVRKFPEIPNPNSELDWDDYFFLLYLNLIEPKLKRYPLLLLYEFPKPLSALSTLKKEDPRVCERFEVYIEGVELCNAFNELTNLDELQERFENQHLLKKKYYQYELPRPEQFYSVMKKGYPPSAGIALGVERLMSTLFEIENPFL